MYKIEFKNIEMEFKVSDVVYFLNQNTCRLIDEDVSELRNRVDNLNVEESMDFQDLVITRVN